MGRYLDDARILYNEALHDLERWGQTKNHVLLRDAAEKAWGAVTQAASELLDAYGRRVPSGTNARREEIAALERRHQRVRSLRLRARFSDSLDVLHKECFYDGQCPLPLVTDMVVEDTKEFLDDVAASAVGGASLAVGRGADPGAPCERETDARRWW